MTTLLSTTQILNTQSNGCGSSQKHNILLSENTNNNNNNDDYDE